MTTPRRDNLDTPYFDWVRKENLLDSTDYRLSVTDNDHWIHQFSKREERHGRLYPFDSLMLVEVKTFNATVPFAQRDTLEVVGFLLRRASVWNGRRHMVRVKDRRPGRLGSWRDIMCYGKHILRMSEDRPDRSKSLHWDDRPISVPELIEIYQFKRDPDNPSRMIDLRRHHLRPKVELHPKFAFLERL